MTAGVNAIFSNGLEQVFIHTLANYFRLSSAQMPSILATFLVPIKNNRALKRGYLECCIL